jgi:hypothetical protein
MQNNGLQAGHPGRDLASYHPQFGAGLWRGAKPATAGA